MRRRQHVNPLGFGFTQRHGGGPDIPAGRRLEIEIGCADAQFLFERARVDPARFYVGIEIRHQLVDDVNRRARSQNQPVAGVFAHAMHLDALIPAGRAECVYINFPDPWFKSRHHKRRMIDRELALASHAALAPGGQVLVQTDVWGIALDAMAVFDAMDDRFENAAGPWSFWRGGNPFGARSWREQHCEEDGLPIWRLLYDRR